MLSDIMSPMSDRLAAIIWRIKYTQIEILMSSIFENISSTAQDLVVELPGSRALSLLKVDLFKVCNALVIC